MTLPADTPGSATTSCPSSRPKVLIASHVVNYGTGCFEGIRAYWNAEHEQLYALLPRRHVDRLLRSCRILNLRFEMDRDALGEILLELLRRNGHRSDAYIRPLVFKSGATIRVGLTGIPTLMAAYTIPMGEYLDIDRGLVLTFSAWRRARSANSYRRSALIDRPVGFW
jgi:branched-chain amino acid aminotransferase